MNTASKDCRSDVAPDACIYTAEQRAEVIAVALTDPQKLGLTFGCWTLDRLQDYLNEHRKLPMKRSRIDEVLINDGLRWRMATRTSSARNAAAAGQEVVSFLSSTLSRRCR